MASDGSPLVCTPCATFYEQYASLPDTARMVLEEKMRGETGRLWLASRQVRLTASTLSTVPKRKSTCPSKAVKGLMNTTFSGNAATEHGTTYEGTAIQALEELTDL